MRRTDVHAVRARTRTLRWLAFVMGFPVLAAGAGSTTAAGTPQQTDLSPAAENPYQRGPHAGRTCQ